MNIKEEFQTKEKRSSALTVRLPASVLKKVKKISKKFNYSQSEVIETLVESAWKDLYEKKDKDS